MKKTIIIVFVTSMILGLIGCATSTSEGIDVISELPEDAVNIFSQTFNGEYGTFTYGGFRISGTGYLILETEMQSGSLRKLGIVMNSPYNKKLISLNKPMENGLYAFPSMEFDMKSGYVVQCDEAEYIVGTVNVYFVGSLDEFENDSDLETEQNTGMSVGVTLPDGIYYIYEDGTDEQDEPMVSNTGDLITIVFVKKDGYATFNFSQTDNLLSELEKECDKMIDRGTSDSYFYFTQEDAAYLIEEVGKLAAQ